MNDSSQENGYQTLVLKNTHVWVKTSVQVVPRWKIYLHREEETTNICQLDLGRINPCLEALSESRAIQGHPRGILKRWSTDCLEAIFESKAIHPGGILKVF